MPDVRLFFGDDTWNRAAEAFVSSRGSFKNHLAAALESLLSPGLDGTAGLTIETKSYWMRVTETRVYQSRLVSPWIEVGEKRT